MRLSKYFVSIFQRSTDLDHAVEARLEQVLADLRREALLREKLQRALNDWFERISVSLNLRLSFSRSALCGSVALIGATPSSLRIDVKGKGKVMNLLNFAGQVPAQFFSDQALGLELDKDRVEITTVATANTIRLDPEVDDNQRCAIVLPDAKASRFSNGKLIGKKTHQLTLRVSEDYRDYMLALQARVEAESLGQLVRWSLTALEQALDAGYVIERSDGVLVGDHVVDGAKRVTKTARQGDGEIVRIPVKLDADQHARVKRLSDRTRLGLVEMAATALGVLDAWATGTAAETVQPESVEDDGGRASTATESAEDIASK